MTFPNEVERRQKIEEMLAAWEKAPRDERETLVVPWQDERKPRPVIRLPVDFVVLNPRSHRIQSQLESDPVGRAIVERDRFTDEAQQVIANLLRTPKDDYEEFKANIAEEGQRDPGIITRIGLLVNANRRAVSLRDLNPHGYIRVAVLPEGGAGEKEISTLELKLQIQKDFRLDYTFTNLLLFVEDMKASHSYSDEDVARALNYAASSDKKALREGAKQVQQHTRILATIRTLQARSDGRLPLTFFDDKRQLLIDLDVRNESLKNTMPDDAERVREARFVAVLAEADYRPTRSLTAETIADYFIPAIEDIADFGPDLAAMTEQAEGPAPVPSGVGDLLDDPSEQAGAETFRPIVDLLARSHGAEAVSIPSDGDPRSVDREDLLRKIRESIETTNDEARSVGKKARSLGGPLELIRDARIKTERALEAYKEVANQREFRTSQFKFEMKRLSQAVRRIQDEIGQNGPR
jgi:hypothetical protein